MFMRRQERSLKVAFYVGGMWMASNYQPLNHCFCHSGFDCSVLLT